MGHTTNTSIQVQAVKGGFIMTTYDDKGGAETEVFNSPGKLLKAFRAIIDTSPGKAEPAAE